MEETINLKDLLSIIFRKAKMIIIIMLIFGALAGALKLVPILKNSTSSADKTLINKQYQKDLEKYNIEKSSIENQIEKNKEDIKDTENHMLKSPIFQINPFAEYVTECQLYITGENDKIESDFSKQVAYYYYKLANSGEASESIASDSSISVEAKYLRELYNVSIDNDIIKIKAIGNEEQQPSKIVEILLTYLQDKKSIVAQNLGAHNISILNQSTSVQVDNDLVTSQTKIKTLVKDLNLELTENNNKLIALVRPVEVTASTNVLKSVLKYVIVGLVLGAIIGVMTVLALFFFSNKIANYKVMKLTYDIPYLTTLPSHVIQNKKAGFWTKIISRIEGNYSEKLSQKEHIEMLKVKLLLQKVATDKPIMITGSVDLKILGKICELLTESCKAEDGLSFQYANNIVLSSSTMNEVSNCSGVLLVEENGKSSLDMVEQEIEVIKNLDAAILGYVMV